MSSQKENAVSADQFSAIAQQFCAAVEVFGPERLKSLSLIYRILPVLIGEAIRLPEVSGETEK